MGVLLQNLQQLVSEMGILTGELEGKGREDLLKIAAVLEVPRAEEASPELPILGGCLGERLGDGRFTGPSHSVEPEDALTAVVCKPTVNILEDFCPRSLQTSLSILTKVASVRGGMWAIENGKTRRFLSSGQTVRVKGEEMGLTVITLTLLLISCCLS